MYRAMIVEDSRLARVELANLLNDVANIELIAEADSLNSARRILSQQSIDLVFLDIDLPDGNGFELLESLLPAPQVIFTTAFSEFAVRAFEQHAVDYLLKPIAPKRLKKACQRLRPIHQHQDTDASLPPLALDERFFLKDGQQSWLVALADVERFEAMGNYTRVHFSGNKPLIYRTLAQIESRLPSKAFFRASRSDIVQVNQITQTTHCSSGNLVLELVSGAKIEVSRRRLAQFRQLFAL
ncbi:LytR/AlgR family response regulator transcription factor [Thaumasiovibrio subtropicus]|uniref:LytR/AlgR family response regulator transcription factor n=1 Tax=Thaumasiovibrio subtropicus TaxID=1891207 RepID=UPI000B363CEE|nr:LytTR family DNA-binding domain-containing protein [Thaumasiovibrio subtropicus]